VAQEVLKNTPTTHGDYESIESVLNRLEVVTASVNARKSEAERVRKMAEIRAHVDGAEVHARMHARSFSSHRAAVTDSRRRRGRTSWMATTSA